MTTKNDEDELLRSVALQNANSILIARQRAEQGSEFYLNEAQRLAHMGSWAYDPSGFFDYWSQELFRIYGLDPAKGAPTLEEYLGLVHPQDREFMARIMEMLAKGSGCDVKKRIVRPNGEIRCVRCVGVPVVDNGVLKSIVGNAMDVTEQEQLTQELRRREMYLGEAQRLSHTGSFGWRVSTGEILWSEETFRIFQYDRTTKPTVGLVLQRVHPEDRALVKQTIDRASQDGKDFDHEYRLLMPDGSVKYLHVAAHALNDESDRIEFVGAVTDVTAAKQAQEALHQARAELAHVTRVATVGEMTASIAHEVNQPLAAVVTNAGAGLRWISGPSPDLEEARQALGRIIKEGNRASEVIARIRALVKKSPPRKDRLDINETILEVILLTDTEVHRNRMSLQTQLSNDLPPILGDRIQLQQVILNLIKNAVEAMSAVSEGSRELLVSSGKDKSQGVLVAVRDSGPGLDPEAVAHLFDHFYTTKPEGMGMGLAISRSIIEAHGGRLWATPNEPQGAVFQFTLPADGDSMP